MAAMMKAARLGATPAVLVAAADYDTRMRPVVLCADADCLCPVQGVSASVRNVDGERVKVSAFFRLPRGAEKDGKGHRPSCRFNVQRIVNRLVAHSREIRRFDKNAEPILEGLPGGRAEFRLHILMELLPQTPGYTASEDAGRARTEAGLIGTKYVRSRRLLTPYLRMAKAVLSLMARVRERPALEEWIGLVYEDRIIPWSRYFYGLDDYGDLYAALAARGQYKRSGTGDIPAAVVVGVKPQEPKLTAYGKYRIIGRSRVCTAGVCGEIAVCPVIYARDIELARAIVAHGSALVCAVPTIREPRRADKPWFKPSADLNLSVISRSQVCGYAPTPPFP